MNELIKAIKDNPILWDHNHSHFHKTKYRRLTYDGIARDLNMKSGKHSKLSLIIIMIINYESRH